MFGIGKDSVADLFHALQRPPFYTKLGIFFRYYLGSNGCVTSLNPSLPWSGAVRYGVIFVVELTEFPLLGFRGSNTLFFVFWGVAVGLLLLLLGLGIFVLRRYARSAPVPPFTIRLLRLMLGAAGPMALPFFILLLGMADCDYGAFNDYPGDNSRISMRCASDAWSSIGLVASGLFAGIFAAVAIASTFIQPMDPHTTSILQRAHSRCEALTVTVNMMLWVLLILIRHHLVMYAIVNCVCHFVVFAAWVILQPYHSKFIQGVIGASYGITWWPALCLLILACNPEKTQDSMMFVSVIGVTPMFIASGLFTVYMRKIVQWKGGEFIAEIQDSPAAYEEAVKTYEPYGSIGITDALRAMLVEVHARSVLGEEDEGAAAAVSILRRGIIRFPQSVYLRVQHAGYLLRTSCGAEAINATFSACDQLRMNFEEELMLILFRREAALKFRSKYHHKGIETIGTAVDGIDAFDELELKQRLTDVKVIHLQCQQLIAQLWTHLHRDSLASIPKAGKHGDKTKKHDKKDKKGGGGGSGEKAGASSGTRNRSSSVSNNGTVHHRGSNRGGGGESTPSSTMRKKKAGLDGGGAASTPRSGREMFKSNRIRSLEDGDRSPRNDLAANHDLFGEEDGRGFRRGDKISNVGGGQSRMTAWEQQDDDVGGGGDMIASQLVDLQRAAKDLSFSSFSSIMSTLEQLRLEESKADAAFSFLLTRGGDSPEMLQEFAAYVRNVKLDEAGARALEARRDAAIVAKEVAVKKEMAAAAANAARYQRRMEEELRQRQLSLEAAGGEIASPVVSSLTLSDGTKSPPLSSPPLSPANHHERETTTVSEVQTLPPIHHTKVVPFPSPAPGAARLLNIQYPSDNPHSDGNETSGGGVGEALAITDEDNNNLTSDPDRGRINYSSGDQEGAGGGGGGGGGPRRRGGGAELYSSDREEGNELTGDIIRRPIEDNVIAREKVDTVKMVSHHMQGLHIKLRVLTILILGATGGFMWAYVSLAGAATLATSDVDFSGLRRYAAMDAAFGGRRLYAAAAQGDAKTFASTQAQVKSYGSYFAGEHMTLAHSRKITASRLRNYYTEPSVNIRVAKDTNGTISNLLVSPSEAIERVFAATGAIAAQSLMDVVKFNKKNPSSNPDFFYVIDNAIAIYRAMDSVTLLTVVEADTLVNMCVTVLSCLCAAIMFFEIVIIFGVLRPTVDRMFVLVGTSISKLGTITHRDRAEMVSRFRAVQKQAETAAMNEPEQQLQIVGESDSNSGPSSRRVRSGSGGSVRFTPRVSATLSDQPGAMREMRAAVTVVNIQKSSSAVKSIPFNSTDGTDNELSNFKSKASSSQQFRNLAVDVGGSGSVLTRNNKQQQPQKSGGGVGASTKPVDGAEWDEEMGSTGAPASSFNYNNNPLQDLSDNVNNFNSVSNLNSENTKNNNNNKNSALNKNKLKNVFMTKKSSKQKVWLQIWYYLCLALVLASAAVMFTLSYQATDSLRSMARLMNNIARRRDLTWALTWQTFELMLCSTPLGLCGGVMRTTTTSSKIQCYLNEFIAATQQTHNGDLLGRAGWDRAMSDTGAAEASWNTPCSVLTEQEDLFEISKDLGQGAVRSDSRMNQFMYERGHCLAVLSELPESSAIFTDNRTSAMRGLFVPSACVLFNQNDPMMMLGLNRLMDEMLKQYRMIAKTNNILLQAAAFSTIQKYTMASTEFLVGNIKGTILMQATLLDVADSHTRIVAGAFSVLVIVCIFQRVWLRARVQKAVEENVAVSLIVQRMLKFVQDEKRLSHMRRVRVSSSDRASPSPRMAIM